MKKVQKLQNVENVETVEQATQKFQLTSASKLDISINKDDLIDILISNKIEELENKIALCNKVKLELDESRKKLTESQEKLNIEFAKKELKDILKPDFLENIESCKQVYNGKISIDLKKDMIIEIKGKTNHNFNKFEKQFNEIHDTRRKLDKEIDDLQLEIKTIEKSPRRIKSAFLKNYLINTEDGKNILNLLNNSKDLKELPCISK